MERLQAYLSDTENFEQWLNETKESVRASLGAANSSQSDQLQANTHTIARAMANSIINADPEPYRRAYQQIAKHQADEGMPVDQQLQSVTSGVGATLTTIARLYADDAAQAVETTKRYFDLVALGYMSVSETFLSMQQQQISNQQEVLRELSTPIVPVYEGVLVLPLVGTIDSRRAMQFIEGMLENITEKAADVVIIDITGVRVIDTSVASYLSQAARAARLLGSQVILVGINAEIAQTLVQLGIELSGITTRADLQSGIAYALELQGMQITKAVA